MFICANEKSITKNRIYICIKLIMHICKLYSKKKKKHIKITLDNKYIFILKKNAKYVLFNYAIWMNVYMIGKGENNKRSYIYMN